jgi:gas vesicle protein
MLFKKKKKHNGLIGGILLTGTVGGILSYWLTTESGKEARKDMGNYVNNALTAAKEKRDGFVKDAKEFSDNLVNNANKVMNLTKEFAEGSYKGPIEAIEKEIEKIKTYINSTIMSFKGAEIREKSTDDIVEDIFLDADDRTLTEYDDDTFVKREGMGHRFN